MGAPEFFFFRFLKIFFSSNSAKKIQTATFKKQSDEAIQVNKNHQGRRPHFFRGFFLFQYGVRTKSKGEKKKEKKAGLPRMKLDYLQCDRAGDRHEGIEQGMGMCFSRVSFFNVLRSMDNFAASIGPFSEEILPKNNQQIKPAGNILCLRVFKISPACASFPVPTLGGLV